MVRGHQYVTLARVPLGLERPDAGTVRYDGVDPFALRAKELLNGRRRVQTVFQDPFASLNARMSAADLMGEPWHTHRDVVPGAKARDKRIRELLSLTGSLMSLVALGAAGAVGAHTFQRTVLLAPAAVAGAAGLVAQQLRAQAA
ncbi:hypothetical protein [Streptomyces sp. NPDC014676]|uniref:hypothetical protein n=1 Tax=Streptomyces sp. NPDC014676 TaxID=3364879 RepID=UPI003701E147